MDEKRTNPLPSPRAADTSPTLSHHDLTVGSIASCSLLAVLASLPPIEDNFPPIIDPVERT
ncbi:MAG TPA: hypothetical protein VN157_05935 [Caulobacter sp.]|nr:hypothetical protein [Caulobacter sp.]